MGLYRKKPVVIEAFQWTGGPDQDDDPGWLVQAMMTGVAWISRDKRGIHLVIKTLEGDHRAIPGDWIIKGVAGELYPCKDDIFKKTYEKVENPTEIWGDKYNSWLG